MIIPLGLGGKLPRIPWITLTICTLLIIFFPGQMKKQIRVEEEKIKIINQSKLAAVIYELFFEFCKAHGISPIACQNEATQIGNKYYFDTAKVPPKEANISLKESSRLAILRVQFLNALKKDSSRLHRLKYFEKYIQIKKQLKSQMGAHDIKEGLYSANNRGIKALFLAQMSHWGLLHLLSNLFVLIVFGVYLEMRLDPIVFLVCYLLGGLVGPPTTYVLNPDSDLHSLGASANIAALMGAFFVVFYRFRMFMGVFWFYSIKRTFLMQVSIVFPLLFILKDAIGLGTESGFMEGGVAHGAHLGGLLVGLIVGFLDLKISPFHWPFRNHEEWEQTQKLKQLSSIKSQSAIAQEIVQKNPDNLFAHLTVLKSSLAQKTDLDSSNLVAIWRNHLPDLIKISLRSKKVGIVIELLSKTPLNLNLTEVLRSFNRIALLEIADWAFDYEELPVAIRLYDAFIELNPASPTVPYLKETLRELAIFSEKDENLLHFIAEYRFQRYQSEFCNLLRSYQPETPSAKYATKS